jgi:hypothetical protein
MDWQRRSSAAWRPSASSSRDFGEIPETRTPEKARETRDIRDIWKLLTGGQSVITGTDVTYVSQSVTSVVASQSSGKQGSFIKFK